ncbi:MAG: methylated-DNA--[Synergistaceae bacterium]|nr:methylated-DNA--[protein]-cysteine S-methyltransferase [Synergistaceae bacterium]
MAASFSHSYSSPLGEITLLSDGENITALYFSDMLRDGSTRAKPQSLPVFEQAREWLNIYFSGKKPGFTPPLKIEGSEFHRSICGTILAIPFGHVMTYSEIAKVNAERRKIPGMS